MLKLVRTLFCSFLLVAILLGVIISPMMSQSSILEDSAHSLRYSSQIQATISPTSGWTSGGEEIVIYGSGFMDLAFTNTTYDGINHQWAKSTANYADQSGQENSIVVDSNGHVHIVSAAGDNYDFIHSVYDGSSWSVTSIKGCEGSYCWDTHMVIDDNDHLHVAYSTGNNYIIYMNFDGTTWSWSQISSSGKVGPVGIAVDSNNNPHVSYSAYGSYCGNGLMLASFDGVDWTSQTVKSGSNRGCSSAIVIEDDDQINIAYQNRDSSKLNFVTGNGVSPWSSDYAVDFGNPASSLYPGYYSSMAVDHQGQFHIAHYDSKEEDLRYSTGAPNGQWTTTIVDSGGNTGRNPAIAIDVAGDPHIVYHSWAGWDLKYATLNPSSPDWQVSNVETAGSVGDSSSIFIDDTGIIHIAYSDDTNNVLRYATKNSGVSVTNEITVQFGQFGYATGELVDDSTIVVNTPVASQADTITLSLWDKDGIEHQLSSTFEFISQDDLDNDGVLNANDDCPNDAGTSTQDLTGCPDDDGDGYSNSGDAFPSDSSENSDSDGDGVGDNADALPNDASETVDSDGDGVGDNSDAFPNDSSENTDSDGDGVGDNSDAFPSNPYEQYDSDGDGVGDNSDAFPNNAEETTDSDGDGVGDNSDAFPMNAFEIFDSDGDGVGDNSDAFPNDANETLDSDGDGIGDLNDLCNNTMQNNSVDTDGCSLQQLNNDTNETDDTQGNQTNATDNTNQTEESVDADGDGVIDENDLCPNTPWDVLVDLEGCSITNQEEIIETEEDGNFANKLLSGEPAAVASTVGVSAILIALIGFLQSNMIAAMLPETLRGLQFLKRKTKLNSEERRELIHLQSVVQAYSSETKLLDDELRVLAADVNARYTNKELKKNTRELLMTLIRDLRNMESRELSEIAFNDSYFGLLGTIDTKQRSQKLQEDLAMRSVDSRFEKVIDEEQKLFNNLNKHIPGVNMRGVINQKDGHEYIEWPVSSGRWYIRNKDTNEWYEWKG